MLVLVGNPLQRELHAQLASMASRCIDILDLGVGSPLCNFCIGVYVSVFLVHGWHDVCGADMQAGLSRFCKRLVASGASFLHRLDGGWGGDPHQPALEPSIQRKPCCWLGVQGDVRTKRYKCCQLDAAIHPPRKHASPP